MELLECQAGTSFCMEYLLFMGLDLHVGAARPENATETCSFCREKQSIEVDLE